MARTGMTDTPAGINRAFTERRGKLIIRSVRASPAPPRMTAATGEFVARSVGTLATPPRMTAATLWATIAGINRTAAPSGEGVTGIVGRTGRKPLIGTTAIGNWDKIIRLRRHGFPFVF